jgi:hypothetical protein
MNEVQRDYLEAKKEYDEAIHAAWNWVERTCKEKGIDYNDEEMTDTIIDIEIEADKLYNVEEKQKSLDLAFDTLREWNIKIIKIQTDVSEEKKENAIKVIEGALSPIEQEKLITLMLRLDG